MPASPLPRQVVILSSVEWGAAWQRHQALASQWAAAGREVFFVENTGFRNPSWRDLSRLLQRAGRLAGASRPAPRSPIPRGVRVVTPLILPPNGRVFRRLNAFLFVPRLLERLEAEGLRPDPLVVAYLPTPTTLRAIELLRPRLVVYDCVDNFRGHSSAPRDLDRTEKRLLDVSGLVLVTSSNLRKDKERLHPHVVEAHHGVSPAFFIAPRPAGPARRLCYFGTVWKALDFAPLGALAEAGFSVDLIGPLKGPLPDLPPGVSLRPAVAHDRLPGLLGRYDALLLPYADDAYNQGVIPAKLYECLATGLPVLASPLPSLKPLAGAITVCRTPADWAAAARALPGPEAEERRRERVAIARSHLESAAFDRIEGEIAAALRRGPPPGEAPAEDRLAAFVRGITWIGALYGVAKVLTLLVQVAAGRWLGPDEYGRANVVMAAAAYLQILPMMGFPLAMSKFVASEADETRRRRVISTILVTFMVWAMACLSALWAARAPLARGLGLAVELVVAALLFSFLTAFYTVFSSPLLGLRRFHHRGAAEALYGLSAPVFLLAFLLFGPADYRAVVGTLSLSLLAGSLYSLWALRSYLRPSFAPSAFGLVIRYALIASLNLLATACVLAPARLILHAAHSEGAVGVFSAYFTSTAQVALALLVMLNSVVVPLASDERGQAEGWRTFRRRLLPLTAGSGIFFLAAGAVALALFGSAYPWRPGWLAAFAGTSVLMLLHGLMASLYAARDLSGLLVSVSGSLLAGLANAGLGLILIPRWGISGGAAALGGGYALGLALYAACAAAGRRAR